MFLNPHPETPASLETHSTVPLGQCPKGWCGQIQGFIPQVRTGLSWQELERRFLEMGFVEGAHVKILHDGPIHHDPIAVRVDDITIALRRGDADAILVEATP